MTNARSLLWLTHRAPRPRWSPNLCVLRQFFSLHVRWHDGMIGCRKECLKILRLCRGSPIAAPRHRFNKQSQADPKLKSTKLYAKSPKPHLQNQPLHDQRDSLPDLDNFYFFSVKYMWSTGIFFLHSKKQLRGYRQAKTCVNIYGWGTFAHKL